MKSGKRTIKSQQDSAKIIVAISVMFLAAMVVGLGCEFVKGWLN